MDHLSYNFATFYISNKQSIIYDENLIIRVLTRLGKSANIGEKRSREYFLLNYDSPKASTSVKTLGNAGILS